MTLPEWGRKVLLLAIIPVPRKGVNRQQTAWLGLPVCPILKPQLNWKGNGEGCFRPLRFNYLVLDGKKIENKIKARVKKTLKRKL